MIEQAFSITLRLFCVLCVSPVNRGNLFTAAALLIPEQADNKMKLKIEQLDKLFKSKMSIENIDFAIIMGAMMLCGKVSSL